MSINDISPALGHQRVRSQYSVTCQIFTYLSLGTAHNKRRRVQLFEYTYGLVLQSIDFSIDEHRPITGNSFTHELGILSTGPTGRKEGRKVYSGYDMGP